MHSTDKMCEGIECMAVETLVEDAQSTCRGRDKENVAEGWGTRSSREPQTEEERQEVATGTEGIRSSREPQNERRRTRCSGGRSS